MLAHLGTSFLLLLRSLQLLPHYKAWLADNCCTQLLHLPFWGNKEPSFIQPHSSNLSLLSLFLSFSRSVIFSYYKQSNTWDQCLAKLTQLLRLSSIFRNIKERRRSGETKNVLWRNSIWINTSCIVSVNGRTIILVWTQTICWKSIPDINNFNNEEMRVVNSYSDFKRNVVFLFCAISVRLY